MPNWYYHSSNMATWITQKQSKSIRFKLGSRTSTICDVMLYSPILWPIMENLSHCRAEGANFTDHQPGSESYHTYRDCFYLKLVTSLLRFQCRKTAPHHLDMPGIIDMTIFHIHIHNINYLLNKILILYEIIATWSQSPSLGGDCPYCPLVGWAP